MRKIFLGFAVLALLFHGFAPYVQARTGYVSDMLILTFREGPSKSFAVKKALQSNTPLEVLEEKDGYLNVRLTSGETGWVEKQYVVYDPPKTIIIEKLTQQNQALEKELEALQAELENDKRRLSEQAETSEEKTASMKSALEEARKKVESLEGEVKSLQEKYDTLLAQSGDVQQIVKKSELLTRENKQLAKDIALLENQTSHQFRTGMIKWFLSGVGVLLLGWILGNSVSSRKKRRSSLLD
ncbi:TIGR04211 family SH3 domain-containing protein [Desulfospira joergensenii]|uniref:TIGR04211 family SH3 domain-containing protein n=1 Tax=Desulfospira joergensenii TaxID=53329 RepID=UPI0003B4201E|nr:TIGR04211 family SH3 domain-containing protein [Desulfospira joergensenii]